MFNELGSLILTVGIVGEFVFAVSFVIWCFLEDRKWRKRVKKAK